jgi:hypothetical protein
MMKYDSLNTFLAAKEHARAEIRRSEQSIAWHWTQLKDPAVRGAMAKGAASDLLRSSSVGRQFHELLNGRFTGPLISTVGLAYASTRGGVGKRVLFSTISLALGKLFGGLGGAKSGMLSGIAERIGAVVSKIRESRSAKATNANAYEPEVERSHF